MPRAMHQFHCRRPGGGGEGETRVAQVVQVQVGSTHRVSSPLPRHLQDTCGEGMPVTPMKTKSSSPGRVKRPMCSSIRWTRKSGMAMVRRPAADLGSFTKDFPLIVMVRLCSMRRVALARSTSFRLSPSSSATAQLAPRGERHDELQMLGHRCLQGVNLSDCRNRAFGWPFHPASRHLAW